MFQELALRFRILALQKSLSVKLNTVFITNRERNETIDILLQFSRLIHEILWVDSSGFDQYQPMLFLPK